VRDKQVRYFPLTRLHIDYNDFHPITSLPFNFESSNSFNNYIASAIVVLYWLFFKSLFFIIIIIILLANDGDA